MLNNFKEGAKYYWRHNSIAWNPEQTKNMSLVELRKHCDDYFVRFVCNTYGNTGM